MSSGLDASEWRTRKALVDPMLRAAGWTITPSSASTPIPSNGAHAIEEFPTTNGPADYALCVDGQLLGVVEAKRRAVDPHGVLTQAERYAQGFAGTSFNFRGFRVPFLYATSPQSEVITSYDEVSKTAFGAGHSVRVISTSHSPVCDPSERNENRQGWGFHRPEGV